MARWAWKIDLKPLMGKSVKIETRDGVYLKGKLTGVEHYAFVMDKRNIKVPTILKLDNDPEKVVEISRIVKVEVKR